MSLPCSKHNRGKKLAEESQLLAEERFIIQAIKKIRTQRNCLQIERLQLESMLAEQKHGPLKRTVETQQIVEDNTRDSIEIEVPVQQSFEFVDIKALKQAGARIMNEDLCNFEELNLTVSQPLIANAEASNYNCEEEDEGDESSEDENMFIDMDMFMTDSLQQDEGNAEEMTNT